jgi:hypothetical protein
VGKWEINHVRIDISKPGMNESSAIRLEVCNLPTFALPVAKRCRLEDNFSLITC